MEKKTVAVRNKNGKNLHISGENLDTSTEIKTIFLCDICSINWCGLRFISLGITTEGKNVLLKGT